MAKKSALGEYVHYATENYIKYGVARFRKTPDLFNLKESNFLQNRTKGIKTVTQSTLDELETRLKENAAESIVKDEHKTRLSYQNKIDLIYQYFAERTSEKVLSSFIESQADSPLKPTDSIIESLYGTTLTEQRLEDCQLILRQINRKISRINKKGFLKDGEKQISELVRLYRSAAPITGRLEIGKDATPQSILGQIQEGMNRALLISSYTELIGYFGEYWVATAADQVQNLTKNEAIKAIQNYVIGDKGHPFTLEKGQLAQDITKYIQKEGKKKNIYRTRFSKDKVDVEIVINSEDILANVKTYYDASQITLQDSVSLMDTLVALENYDKFGTHWLNMHAGQLRGDYTTGDSILEKEIGYEALVIGNPLKQNVKEANVFVYINRHKGEVQVYNTSDLLISQFKKFRINPKLSSIVFDND